MLDRSVKEIIADQDQVDQSMSQGFDAQPLRKINKLQEVVSVFFLII